MFRERSIEEIGHEAAACLDHLAKTDGWLGPVLTMTAEWVSASMVEGLGSVAFGDFPENNTPELRPSLLKMTPGQFQEFSACLFALIAQRPEGFHGAFGVLGSERAGTLEAIISEWRVEAFPEIELGEEF